MGITIKVKTTEKEQHKTLVYLKSSLRHFLTNEVLTRGTTKAERALHLKRIHQVLSGTIIVNQRDQRKIQVGYGGGYTCNISSSIEYAFSTILVHFWFEDLVAVVYKSIRYHNLEKDSYLANVNCFENCCHYAGFNEAKEFRLWLLEYCYKTLTKKGKI